MRRAAAAAHQLTRTLYAPRPSPSARILSSSSSSSFSSNAGRNHYRPVHQHHHPQSLHPALALGQRTMATSSQQQHPATTTTPPGPERQREGDKEQKKPALLLEDSSAAAAAEGTHKIDLSDGGQGSVKLDSLGPLVVHKDGTTSRISNWGEMTRIERENTLRVLGKRNQLRLGQLRGQAGGNGNADGGNAS